MNNTVRFKEVTRFSVLFQHLTWSERANVKMEPAYKIFVILSLIRLELIADRTGDCQVMCPYFRQCYRRNTVRYYKFCRIYILNYYPGNRSSQELAFASLNSTKSNNEWLNHVTARNTCMKGREKREKETKER